MERFVVGVVDRQPLFRVGVCHILSRQPEIEVFDSPPDDNVLSLIELRFPNVLLLDIDQPSLKGLDLVRKISLCCPTARIIMMASGIDDRQLFEIIKTGVVAFLDKSAGAEELTETVMKVTRGEYPINESVLCRPDVARHVLKQFQGLLGNSSRAQGDIVAPLTSRETQILNHIADGNSNKQIASILNISEQTAKNHVSNILRKLNANDRAHAVFLAIRHGWILADKMPSPDITTASN